MVRMLHIMVDGKEWTQPAGRKTALEYQHEIANPLEGPRPKSVRVREFYREAKKPDVLEGVAGGE